MKTATAKVFALLAAVMGLSVATLAPAQVLLSEDFTGATSSSNGGGVGNWLFYNGACLTAGTGTNTTPPATTIPACTTVLSTYYNIANYGGVSQKVADAYLVGGAKGYLGGSTAPSSISAQQADPVGQGALRFTNGSQGGSYGYGERGSIVSTQAYSANSGISVTFKTVTYHGNGGGNGSGVSGANGNEGADGISFFMMDGCVPLSGATMPTNCTASTVYSGGSSNAYTGNFPAIGGTGGSLAYSCSNNNTPYDGLVGAYLGVGIDEYGNFLNGTTVSLSTQSGLGSGITPVASGDNTYSGGGLYANRIGIRGAGSISWQALTNAYGTDPNNSTMPYYPAGLATACANGATYDSNYGKCYSCSSGLYSGSRQCTTTASTTNCPTPPSGYTYTYDSNMVSSGYPCEICPSTATYTASSTSGTAGTCVTTTPSSPTAETYAQGGTSCPTAPSGNSYTLNSSLSNAHQCVECPSSYAYDTTTSTSNPYGTCDSTAYSTATFKAKSSGSCGSAVSTGYTGSNACATCASGSTYTKTVSGYTYGACATITNNTPTGTAWAVVPSNSTSAKCASGSTFNGNLAYGYQCVACPSTTTYNPTTSTSYPYGSCGTSSSAAPGTPVAALTTTSTSSATSSSATNVTALAVQATCKNGALYNYKNWLTNYSSSTTGTSAGSATLANTKNTAGILDYPALSSTILSGIQIANESAATRGNATPIYYSLTITQDGKLSMSYAVNGSPSYTSIISNQSITSSNGPLPAWVRFGFAGSTGGSSNVHEVLCFKAAPASASASSAAANQKPAGKVQTGSYAYFASYVQINSSYVGHLTANVLSTNSDGSLSIASVPTWDASCVLTGATAAQCATGVATTAQPWSTSATGTFSPRAIATWNGTQGAPLEWANLSGDQQTALAVGDPSSASSVSGSDRLNYLRGDRSQEISASSTCPQLSSYGMPCFRDRSSVLADIIDSSPTWVGPPQSSYTATWGDRLYSSTSAPENSGTQNYTQFITAEQTRTNIVYAGANDGMLHGFRSGANTSAGAFDTTAANDGEEVLAYMPGAVLNSVASSSSSGCPSPVPAPMGATLSVVQNIHGVSPAAGSSAACVAPSLDYSAVQYGHNFSVDATPGTGDLFYNGTWHTWLAGGLGAGGAAIYALDITDPVTAEAATGSTPESALAGLVQGEWTPDTLNCVNNPSSGTCGVNLGNTYGTPLIRRMHDGKWAIIFGNGYGSASGDAGIYVMTISGNGAGNGITTYTYYLSTNTASTTAPNGIAYVSSVDFDQDHMVDFVYAGDLQGNVWRFDLTSQTESTWTSTSPFKLFHTPTGQPITTQVQVASGATGAGNSTVIVTFGTGQRTQFTNLSGAVYPTYSTTTTSGTTTTTTTTPYTQSVYGVWDWNMSAWNAKGSVQFASLTAAQATTYGANPASGSPLLAPANLSQQVTLLSIDTGTNGADVDATASAICWAGTTGCTSSTTAQFGWYFNLPTTGEQIIYNPEIYQGVLIVSSTIPANNSPVSCNIASDTGYTYAVSVLNGQAVSGFFSGTAYSKYADSSAMGEQTNATGTPYLVTTANGTVYMIYPTTSSSAGNGGTLTPINPPKTNVAKRMSWVQLR